MHKKGDTVVPDYERCIAIATTAAIKEMVIPGALAVFMPRRYRLHPLVQGPRRYPHRLALVGFMLAIAMSNAGGAWDNAKKLAKQLGSLEQDPAQGALAARRQSVGVGVVVMLVILYFIQKKIDADYAVKRVEVEASIAATKANFEAKKESRSRPTRGAYKAMKELEDEAADYALSTSTAEKLVAALRNPVAGPKKPALQPVSSMDIQVASS